ncbi:unnamed protein product [Aphis gossypii]|uniref:Uncharacterized protein n=1 Tax=Aphis gossypii TaxID=80765 RepID=A0A9P0J517_APHGO|nr:unnamed protein product [Aphis gossypii]
MYAIDDYPRRFTFMRIAYNIHICIRHVCILSLEFTKPWRNLIFKYSEKCQIEMTAGKMFWTQKSINRFFFCFYLIFFSQSLFLNDCDSHRIRQVKYIIGASVFFCFFFHYYIHTHATEQKTRSIFGKIRPKTVLRAMNGNRSSIII